jgi:hypothetical protein
VRATVNADPTLLEHTGLYSVQLQPANSSPAAEEPAESDGGSEEDVEAGVDDALVD